MSLSQVGSARLILSQRSVHQAETKFRAFRCYSYVRRGLSFAVPAQRRRFDGRPGWPELTC
jgi:hypothetical protein